jgi:hypothetical protein
MVKRRSLVIGLGALATGSGAVFSSAAFANSAQAGANFQVVVEDELIVEAGEAFRDGEGFAPDGDKYRDLGDNIIFSGNNGLGDVSFEDLPVAGATDGTNDDLDLAVATKIDTDVLFSGFLQIRNEGTEDKDVGVDFSDYGSAAEGGGQIAKDLVSTVYQFEADGDIVSPNPNTPGGATAGEPETYVTVEAGESLQIDLNVDTTNKKVSNRLTDYVDLDEVDPFADGGERATIDLVDEIAIGTSGEQSDPAPVN